MITDRLCIRSFLDLSATFGRNSRDSVITRPNHSGLFCFVDNSGLFRYFPVSPTPNDEELSAALEMIQTFRFSTKLIDALCVFYRYPDSYSHIGWSRSVNINMEKINLFCEKAKYSIVFNEEQAGVIEDDRGQKPETDLAAHPFTGVENTVAAAQELDAQKLAARAKTDDSSVQVQQFSGESTASLEVVSSSVRGVSAQTDSTVADNTAECCVIA